METNKIDQTIKEKFENRTFTPSASAWERLQVQLNDQPKTVKKPWFLYASIAASILILVVLGIQFFSSEKQEITPMNDVVVSPTKEIKIDDKSLKKDTQTIVNEVFVKNEFSKRENQKSSKSMQLIKNTTIINNANKIAMIDEIDTKNSQNQAEIKDEKMEVVLPKINKIKVNADDLLYAVTHTPEEVKKYYAQHQIDRNELLKTIENELKKSKLKVHPETILAEVERTITEDDFQNNFLQFLKKRVSDIAVAIATRND